MFGEVLMCMTRRILSSLSTRTFPAFLIKLDQPSLMSSILVMMVNITCLSFAPLLFLRPSSATLDILDLPDQTSLKPLDLCVIKGTRIGGNKSALTKLLLICLHLI